MWPWGRKKAPEPELSAAELAEAQSYADELNDVRTRVERLELDSAERQLSVLNAVEKCMTQLRAREAKRARDTAESVEVDEGEAGDRSVRRLNGRPAPEPTAHLAQRLRRF